MEGLLSTRPTPSSLYHSQKSEEHHLLYHPHHHCCHHYYHQNWATMFLYKIYDLLLMFACLNFQSQRNYSNIDRVTMWNLHWNQPTATSAAVILVWWGDCQSGNGLKWPTKILKVVCKAKLTLTIQYKQVIDNPAYCSCLARLDSFLCLYSIGMVWEISFL